MFATKVAQLRLVLIGVIRSALVRVAIAAVLKVSIPILIDLHRIVAFAIILLFRFLFP
jgi:hypothetical protein